MRDHAQRPAPAAPVRPRLHAAVRRPRRRPGGVRRALRKGRLRDARGPGLHACDEDQGRPRPAGLSPGHREGARGRRPGQRRDGHRRVQRRQRRARRALDLDHPAVVGRRVRRCARRPATDLRDGRAISVDVEDEFTNATTLALPGVLLVADEKGLVARFTDGRTERLAAEPATALAANGARVYWRVNGVAQTATLSLPAADPARALRAPAPSGAASRAAARAWSCARTRSS